MAEYVDRDQAIETVKFYDGDPDGIPLAIRSLKVIPTAYVRPVVYGKVLYDAERNKETCSVCGCEYIMVLYKETTNLVNPIISSSNMHFCPNCGADLRREKGDA